MLWRSDTFLLAAFHLAFGGFDGEKWSVNCLVDRLKKHKTTKKKKKHHHALPRDAGGISWNGSALTKRDVPWGKKGFPGHLKRHLNPEVSKDVLLVGEIRNGLGGDRD